MKKLLMLVLATILLLNVHSQYHYKIGIELKNNYNTKDVITEIRGNGIKMFNLIMDSIVEFDSPNFLSRGDIEFYSSTMCTITSFSKIKNNIAFNHIKAGGVNCSNAGQLCSNSTVSGNSSGYGLQELNSSNRGCLSIEHQSSWYYIYVQNGGTLTMNITSDNSNDDYDFAVWGAFTSSNAVNNCPPKSNPIRCSYSACKSSTGMGGGQGCRSCGLFGWDTCYENRTGNDISEGSSGDSWVLPLNVSAGDVYLLLVDNFSASNSNYSITWGGTAVLGCTPINLGATIEYFKYDISALEFKTEREYKVDYFSIEHSIDGYTWKRLVDLESKGIENGRVYNFNYTPNFKDNYYRLITTDVDGTYNIYKDILYVENEIKVFVRYYNIIGQEVPADTKGVLIAIDVEGNKYKIYKSW